MKTIIHVNQHKIRSNKENVYSNSVKIIDKQGNVVATVLYRPDRPLN